MGSSHWYQGNSSRKGKYTYLRLGEGATITFKGSGRICEGVAIALHDEVNLEIGNHFFINMSTRIAAWDDMIIGNNFQCSWDCQIFDTDFHSIYNAKTNTVQRILQKVVIGDNVWLANHVSIAKGAYIPSFSTVGAHSYVNKNFSDVKTKGNLFVGTPATLVATDRFQFYNAKGDRFVNQHFKNHPEEEILDVSQLPDFNLNELLNIY
jgi:acetyltransferase-like isoleucine patch superfamily enzyme